MGGASLEDISELLLPGETAVLAAPALRRVVLQLFSKCTVALTDKRVLVLAPVWPRGYGIEAGCDRTRCIVLGNRNRVDGSTVLALDFGDETIFLFLAKKVKGEADQLVAALSADSVAEPGALAVAQAEVEVEDFAEAVDALEEVRGSEALAETGEALQELSALSELSSELSSDETQQDV